MANLSDDFIDRARLKKKLAKWRNIALIALFFLALAIASKDSGMGSAGDHVAYVAIEGFISDDSFRLKALRNIRDDNKVKALIVHVDSPGGTIVGGESLYRVIKQISAKKPVVSTMGSLATSGGYMVAMAANHVVAYSGTITGSIGVLLQTAEVTDLVKKLGINMITIKTSELKGSPSPFEKMTPKVSNYLQQDIDKAGNIFINMVASARGLSKDYVKSIADGKIYMGEDAVSKHLVDEIGDYETAINWLVNSAKISNKLKIRTYNLEEDKSGFWKNISLFSSKNNYWANLNNGGGIVALWKPSLLETK